MAKIDTAGATGTTLQEYIIEIRNKYLDIDPAWNIDPESPDGLAIAIWAETLANIDEGVIHAYQSVDPNSAIGQQLDRIAAFAGLKRQDATHSTAIVTFSGDNLIEIPAGTLVRHRMYKTLWATDNTVITNTNGTASVSVTAVEAGGNSANSGVLTIVASPVAGINSVVNDDAASMGQDEELDFEFRVRRNVSVARIGANQLDNMQSAICSLVDVKQVKIYENIDWRHNHDGIEPKSLAIFVDGGNVDDIVKMIAVKKNPGCGLNKNLNISGKVNVNAETDLGQPINITFFRPEYVSIHVKVEIRGNDKSTEKAIKQAIIDYARSGFEQTSGFSKVGFKIGEDIVIGRLFTPINYVLANKGFVENIYLGQQKIDIGDSKVAIAFNQFGVFDINNIEVVYV